jgi:hypothetical protein
MPSEVLQHSQLKRGLPTEKPKERSKIEVVTMGGESTRRKFEKSFGSWTIEFHDGALSGYVSRLSEAMQECPDDIEAGWSGAAAENHHSIVVPIDGLGHKSQTIKELGLQAFVCCCIVLEGRLQSQIGYAPVPSPLHSETFKHAA